MITQKPEFKEAAENLAKIMHESDSKGAGLIVEIDGDRYLVQVRVKEEESI